VPRTPSVRKSSLGNSLPEGKTIWTSEGRRGPGNPGGVETSIRSSSLGFFDIRQINYSADIFCLDPTQSFCFPLHRDFHLTGTDPDTTHVLSGRHYDYRQLEKAFLEVARSAPPPVSLPFLMAKATVSPDFQDGQSQRKELEPKVMKDDSRKKVIIWQDSCLWKSCPEVSGVGYHPAGPWLIRFARPRLTHPAIARTRRA